MDKDERNRRRVIVSHGVRWSNSILTAIEREQLARAIDALQELVSLV